MLEDPALKRVVSSRAKHSLSQASRMAAVGGSAGIAASAGLEAATLQKLVLLRKKVLGADEMELYELAQAAGAAIDPDVFK